MWAHSDLLGLWMPLDASRGQTKQKMVGTKAVYGILEQVASVQRAQKGYIAIASLWGHPETLFRARLGL